MRVKYLGNSGFAVGVENTLLIFDDISKGRYLKWESLENFERIYIFVTHVHGDHYDPEIFSYARLTHPRISYILSTDVGKEKPETIPKGLSILYMDEGSQLGFEQLQINGYGSTDAGVSYDIAMPYAGRNIRIFHAGDLNDWHWKEENNPEWTRAQGAEFARIVGTIPRAPRMDLAFFPFDPRLGADYLQGPEAFVKAFNPCLLVPMHFGATLPGKLENLGQTWGANTLICPLPTAGAAFDAAIV